MKSQSQSDVVSLEESGVKNNDDLVDNSCSLFINNCYLLAWSAGWWRLQIDNYPSFGRNRYHSFVQYLQILILYHKDDSNKKNEVEHLFIGGCLFRTKETPIRNTQYHHENIYYYHLLLIFESSLSFSWMNELLNTIVLPLVYISITN